MKITFLGAAKTVTGSNFLVEAAGKKFLVDCGMYQGKTAEEMENSDPFLYDVSEIDFMVFLPPKEQSQAPYHTSEVCKVCYSGTCTRRSEYNLQYGIANHKPLCLDREWNREYKHHIVRVHKTKGQQ